MVENTSPADPFADDGTQQITEPGEPPPEVKRDSHDRYLIPHPDTGKRMAWTRATTFANTIADKYNIDLYHNRLVAKGVAMRPDLYAELGTVHIDERDRLNQIAEIAMEAAGKSAKARLGTALHAYTEKIDRGEKVTVPEPWDTDTDAYVKLCRTHQLKIDPNYIEATVVVPSLGVAGTLDRLGFAPFTSEPKKLTIFDLKTGHNVHYGWLEIACQLFVYSQATHIYDHRTHELLPMPEVNQTEAYVIHLPVGEADPKLYRIDLGFGSRVAAAASVVRELRQRKGYATLVEATPTMVDSGDRKGSRKPANDREEPLERGRGPADLRNASDSAKPDKDRMPSEWLDAGIDPSRNVRYQVGKFTSKRWLLADILTLDYEIFGRKKDARARQDELNDAQIDATLAVTALGLEESKPPDDDADDDFDGDDFGDDDTDTETGTKVSDDDDDFGGDDNDADDAKVSGDDNDWGDDIDAEVSGDDDGWGDDEPADAVDGEDTDWDPESAGPPPAPAAKSTPAKRKRSSKAKDEEAANGGEKNKWMAAVFECETLEELETVWRDAKAVGEWNDRLTRAAKLQKEKILADNDDDGDGDDDDW